LKFDYALYMVHHSFVDVVGFGGCSPVPTLDWIGRKAVENHHHQVPFHLLKDVPELSVGDPGTGNLIVEGDNLVALKALLPYYAGQVKCIYIDPPYNTGNEGWVYNDNVNSTLIRDWLGKTVGKEAEDLSRHDKWLCMMYPRLALLKQFLRPDGSIWISMDDSEIVLLRMLMDEIFGRERFIACNVWQKRYSRENREAIGDVHEYLVVYAMNPEKFKTARNRIGLSEQQAKIYKNTSNNPNGRWRGIPMTAQGYRPNQMYEIKTPSGAVHHPPEGRCWSMIEPEFQKLLTAGRIYFGKDKKSQPSVIRYLNEVDGFVPWTWWPHEEVGHTDEAKKEIQALFQTQTAFDTPKPTRLLERVLQIATNPGDLILDSFAGSGTTGHAI
jgi:adenine specific DNA methylase Mod